MRHGFHHHFGGRHGAGRGHGRGPDFMGWGMGGGRGRGGGWDDGERHGRRRMFDGGELRLVLLSLIAEQPRHGYDLIREIEERSGGAYAPSPGVVYPTLTMLDEMGLIGEQKAEGAKKQFAITDAGSAHLAEHAEQAAALMARLAELGEAQGRGIGSPIRRSMANLGTALRYKLMSGEADLELAHQVAEIIDEAARKIERL